jgi:hypothetical protein
MFNWNLPNHFHDIVPPGREVWIVLSILTFHVLLFRWVLNRMPVLREHPDFPEEQG